jgi:hypothetical protein
LIQSNIINYLFRKIKIEKIAKRFDIYPLKDGFGLLSEKRETNWFISLIFLDIHQHTLKKLSTIEHSSQYIQIVANKTDPTKFIWEDDKSWKFGKIVNEKIVIFEDATKIGFYPGCFYGNCFYGLNWYKDKYGEEVSLYICLVNSFNVLDTSISYLQYRTKDGK